MRKNLMLAAAVVGALSAVGSAQAATDVYVSGSSALRTFFVEDLASTICGLTPTAGTVFPFAGLVGWKINDTAVGANFVPDLSAYQCTAVAGNPSGTPTGEVVTLHYSAELGSTWGVAQMYLGASTFKRAYLNPANCGAGGAISLVTGSLKGQVSCTVTNYSHVTDTAATDTSSFLTQQVADIAVSDVEPVLFTLNAGDNWPSANFNHALIPTKLGAAPTTSQANTAAAKMAPMAGQVFSIVANGVPGYPNSSNGLSLSVSSLRTILTTNNYATWSQVPEVGSLDSAGTPINICRRDHGSGTEISTSIAFNGAECGLDSAGGTILAGTVSTYTGATPPFVYEAPSSSDIKSCVESAPGTIGILVVGATGGTNYQNVAISGVQANAHNAAAGIYPMAYENWAGATSAQKTTNPTAFAAAAKLITDAQDVAKLPSAVFGETVTAAIGVNGVSGGTGGSWTISSGIPSSYYGINGLGAGPNTMTAAGFGAVQVVTEAVSRNGDSCAVQTNSNL